MGLAALGEAADVMVGLCFVPFIVLDLQLAIYCDAPGYTVRTYNTEELADDRKKQLSGNILFDDSVNSPQAIRR